MYVRVRYWGHSIFFLSCPVLQQKNVCSCFSWKREFSRSNRNVIVVRQLNLYCMRFYWFFNHWSKCHGIECLNVIKSWIRKCNSVFAILEEYIRNRICERKCLYSFSFNIIDVHMHSMNMQLFVAVFRISSARQPTNKQTNNKYFKYCVVSILSGSGPTFLYEYRWCMNEFLHTTTCYCQYVMVTQARQHALAYVLSCLTNLIWHIPSIW